MDLQKLFDMQDKLDLQKLFETQAGLDYHITKEHPPKEGEDRLEKKILALMVELGELCQEWRGFKFWSSRQEPVTEDLRVVDYKESGEALLETYNPLLEEYVDCLHFILSIGLELNLTDIDIWKVKEINTTNQFIECLGTIYNVHFQKRVSGEVPRVMYEHLFAYFIGLGEMLGFTWEQVEQSYLQKNLINHERQEVGY